MRGLATRGAALGALERSFERRTHAQVYTDVDPLIAALRDELRFAAIVKRMGTAQRECKDRAR